LLIEYKYKCVFGYPISIFKNLRREDELGKYLWVGSDGFLFWTRFRRNSAIDKNYQAKKRQRYFFVLVYYNDDFLRRLADLRNKQKRRLLNRHQRTLRNHRFAVVVFRN